MRAEGRVASFRTEHPYYLLVAAVLLAILVLPAPEAASTSAPGSFAQTMWQARGLDVLVQMVLIFAGVLGLLGLLAETSAPLDQSVAKAVAAERERDLKVLERTSEDLAPREEVRA